MTGVDSAQSWSLGLRLPSPLVLFLKIAVEEIILYSVFHQHSPHHRSRPHHHHLPHHPGYHHGQSHCHKLCPFGGKVLVVAWHGPDVQEYSERPGPEEGSSWPTSFRSPIRVATVRSSKANRACDSEDWAGGDF